MDVELELQRVRENDPHKICFDMNGEYNYIDDMTDEDWEEFGRDVATNNHLETLNLYEGALNDHSMTFLFRGLTRSISIKKMALYENQLSVSGVRSMIPFLQNANNLTKLDLDYNDLQSEGFNLLFRALRNTPIEQLHCCGCDIESIEIDTNHIHRHLRYLHLENNEINADGCRGLAKLLQGGDAALTKLYLDGNEIDDKGVEILAEALRRNKSLIFIDLSNNNIKGDGVAALATTLKCNATLETLHLCNNKIGDDGVAALVDALHRNTTLRELYLRGDTGISKIGKISLLKLVIDVSSIEATLQSNHTLRYVKYQFLHYGDACELIQELIDRAVTITRYSHEVAGREKVRRILIKNDPIRAQLADIQGVTHSVYSEIDSLYLPEVLALMNRYSHNGGKELFPALKSTITGLLSRVDMKLCIQEQMARHEARIEKQAAFYEARISGHRDQIAHYEAEIKATISKRESMMEEHGVKMEELNARLAAMEDTDQKMDQETRAQSNKRRRVDG